jgi:N-acetylmuramic acid 6-phosphate etherase
VAARPWIPGSPTLSPTELRNPRSLGLDRMPLNRALECFWKEERRGVDTLLADPRVRRSVLGLIRAVARAFRRGGRLIYIGAGTSGRLGVLDASECPPTFRTPPDWVQGIIAGGARALHSAVEGAEDDSAAGADAIRARGLTKLDVVVGIAASGRTPFVWGALNAARAAGATTGLISFNPGLEFHGGWKPDHCILPDTGPEVITGSTRLKSGTATKLILNAVTSLAMVQLGKVMDNLMVDLNPSNDKLRDRAVRIVMELTGASRDAVAEVLQGGAGEPGRGITVRQAVNQLRRRRLSRRRPQRGTGP